MVRAIFVRNEMEKEKVKEEEEEEEEEEGGELRYMGPAVFVDVCLGLQRMPEQNGPTRRDMGDAG